MRKLVSIIMATAFVLSLSACGKPAEQEGGKEENAAPSITESVEEKPEDYAFDIKEEVVLFDNEKFKGVVTGYSYDGDFPRIKFDFQIENKTDKEMEYVVRCASINGIGVDGVGLGDLPPLSKVEDELSVEAQIGYGITANEHYKIKKPTDIVLTIEVLNHHEHLSFFYNSPHFYPYGEENAIREELASAPTDKVCFEDEDIKFTYKSFEEPIYESDNYRVKYFIENKTDTALNVYYDDLIANGIEKWYGGSADLSPHSVLSSWLVPEYGYFKNTTGCDFNELDTFEIKCVVTDEITKEKKEKHIIIRPKE